jgi:lysophospholipase L1-like esterase
MRTVSSLVSALVCALSCVSCVTAPAPATNRPTHIGASDPRIARIGRTVEQADGSVQFAYPGVRLLLAFTGKRLSFDAASSGPQSWLEVAVDGGAPVAVHLSAASSTFVAVDGDAARLHQVEIMHRSETWHGTVTVSRFSTDGRFESPPALPSRKILLLGDSVTCGEALKRVPNEQKNATWWDPRHSYGLLLGETFNAQVNLVCHGGRGLVRSWNGHTDDQNLPDYYNYAIADPARPARWDHQRWQPDLIISAIGTNDFTTGIPDREAYVNTYVGLLRELLRHHPQAQIVLTEGAILDGAKKAALTSYIAEAIARTGSARIHYLVSAHHPGDERDGHPTTEQHAAMARELAPQLRAVMGW